MKLALSLVVGFALISLPFVANAQQAGKVWRIGYLGSAPTTESDAARYWAALQQELRDRGYVEGKNLVIEQRFVEGKNERYPAMAAELVRLNVDVIVAASFPAAQAATHATATIPIVIVNVSDPVGRGLVGSLGHPGGNVTGVANYDADLVAKQLELLKAAVPAATRVAIILCTKCGTASAAYVAARRRDWAAAAQSLGMTLLYVNINAPGDFDDAMAATMRERPDAILLVSTPINFILRRELADFAMRQRLPMLATLRENVTAGGLMSYGTSLPDQFRNAATYVDKILRGAKPSELPVEQPTRLELVINLKTARALGLTIPQSLLLRADEVIK
jgi:putative ABC transport system substrate-binding protein